MEDKFIREDLLRLGVLLTVIFGVMAGLKVYDNSTNAIAEIGAKIFNEIITR